MPELIDLSHTIHDGLVTFKGLPAPLICDYLSRAASPKLKGMGTFPVRAFAQVSR
jgi:arylformamidase